MQYIGHVWGLPPRGMSSLPTMKILERLIKTQGRYPVWEIDDLAFFAIWKIKILKGLSHAILGNFSTDQIVVELTKISK